MSIKIWCEKPTPSALGSSAYTQARYFIDGEYAGISAFLNKLDSASERNARMLAVGVLVPLEQGRMGKSWRHAEGLKDLARCLVPRCWL